MTTQFVSRAGQKLQHALDTFEIDVSGKVCADLGCSTGGFTDCLLRNGASKVYAVDTGYGVLDWKLRQNPKVTVMERTNALHIALPEKADVISIDVGWTKQKLIVPKALELLKENGDIISLVKTHYESPNEWLRNGKLLESHLEEVVQNTERELADLGITFIRKIESPVLGQKGGNVEYLFWIRHPKTTS